MVGTLSVPWAGVLRRSPHHTPAMHPLRAPWSRISGADWAFDGRDPAWLGVRLGSGRLVLDCVGSFRMTTGAWQGRRPRSSSRAPCAPAAGGLPRRAVGVRRGGAEERAGGGAFLALTEAEWAIHVAQCLELPHHKHRQPAARPGPKAPPRAASSSDRPKMRPPPVWTACLSASCDTAAQTKSRSPVCTSPGPEPRPTAAAFPRVFVSRFLPGPVQDGPPVPHTAAAAASSPSPSQRSPSLATDVAGPGPAGDDEDCPGPGLGWQCPCFPRFFLAQSIVINSGFPCGQHPFL